MVEQGQSQLNTVDLWARKSTENCATEAIDRVQHELGELQAGWEQLQAAIAAERAHVESHHVLVADFDDAVKRELNWIRDVSRYFADVSELCSDLAEKKSRLQQTKSAHSSAMSRESVIETLVSKAKQLASESSKMQLSSASGEQLAKKYSALQDQAKVTIGTIFQILFAE